MLYLQLSNTKSLRGLIDKLNYSPKLKHIINVPSLSQLSRKMGTEIIEYSKIFTIL